MRVSASILSLVFSLFLFVGIPLFLLFLFPHVASAESVSSDFVDVSGYTPISPQLWQNLANISEFNNAFATCTGTIDCILNTTYVWPDIPHDASIGAVDIKVRGYHPFAELNGGALSAHLRKNCSTPSSDSNLIGYQDTRVNSWLNMHIPITFSFTGQDLATHNYCVQLWAGNARNGTWYIDDIQAKVAYTLSVTPTPSPSPTPTPTPAVPRPLLLIPGIGGSELKVNEDTVWGDDNGHGGQYFHVYPKDETVWVNAKEAALSLDDDYFDVLKMNAEGNSQANIGITGKFLGDGYTAMVDYFLAHGYEMNKTLFIFPYDWRKDIRSTTELLEAKIASIKQQSGAQKIDIVAHSLGGLASRAYISDEGRAQNVEYLFTLGAPHLGAAKFLKLLQYGDCVKYSLGPVCLSISTDEFKDVIQNMISGFQLAPSRNYYSFYTGDDYTHPYPFDDESDIDSNNVIGPLTYDQIKVLLTNLGYNTGLLTPAEEYHTLDDNLSETNGVKVVNIVGSGKPTTGQIIEKNLRDLLGKSIPKKDEVFINGDDTVPLYSAALIDTDKHRSLLGDIPVYFTNQSHGHLVTNGPALTLVENLLSGVATLPAGVATTPYLLNGTVVSVHSPIALHVYDAVGNHTGPTDDGFEEEIPGSSYTTLDDAKFIFLPDTGSYTVKLQAIGEGSFDFKIRKFEDSQNTETILYKDVPLTEATKGETTIDTTSDIPPVLYMDEDGDGTEDSDINYFSKLEGDENYDNTVPVISLDVTPKTIWPPNGKIINVHITGIVSDDNPYQTRIAVDDEYGEIDKMISLGSQTGFDQVIQLRAARKDEDMDGRRYRIKVFATDLAGNTSLSNLDVLVPHDNGNLR